LTHDVDSRVEFTAAAATSERGYLQADTGVESAGPKRLGAVPAISEAMAA